MKDILDALVHLQLRWPNQVRFCTGVSANFVWVICPIYLLFSRRKISLLSFLPQLPTTMHDFPPKKLSQVLRSYPPFSKMHQMLGVLELENRSFMFFSCACFFLLLKKFTFTASDFQNAVK